MADDPRHFAQCPICKSELRNEVDDLVLSFVSASEISLKFPQFSEHTIQNHSRKTGLYLSRMRNKRHVLNVLIERGLSIMKTRGFKLDAGHMIKATELQAKLDGQLIDRSEQTIVGSDEELLAKVRMLGDVGSDSTDSEPDSTDESGEESGSVDDSS